MKKYLCALLLSVIGFGQSMACGFDGYDEWYDVKTDFFDQETIENESFIPFLRTYRNRYGEKEDNISQNAKDWATYFGIKPSQANYLVNNATQSSIDQLVATGKCDDDSLNFIDKKFVKEKRSGLTYLSFAKYIEPYVSVTKALDAWDLWHYRYDCSQTIADLNYDETLENLITAYNSQTNKDLKIRYGYQIVRLAHYKRHYNDAVNYFNQYVESLNYKPEVYYYALCQKAGALNVIAEQRYNTKPVVNSNKQVVLDFMKVFAESKDLKFAAYESLRFSGKLETATQMANKLAKNEACNVYFLLAYNSFNNPIREMEKILEIDVNAPHAKVLMARYLNEVEDFSYSPYEGTFTSARTRMKNVDKGLEIANRQALRCAGSEKDFWNLAAAYLNIYCMDYNQARTSLAKVNCHNDLYKNQKETAETLLDLLTPPVMTTDIANRIYERHASIMDGFKQVLGKRFADAGLTTEHFLIAGSHNNSINGDSEMWTKVIAYAKKPNKTKMDKWLLGNDGNVDLSKLNNNLGMHYFYEGNIEKAYSLVKDGGDTISVPKALSYNVDRVIFSNAPENNNFYDDYVNEVAGNQSFSKVSEKDIIGILYKIFQKTKGTGDQAAKANFLIGNFYYNFSYLGYYRSKLGYNNFNDVAAAYYFKSLGGTTDRELKARSLFGLAKCQQEGDLIRNGEKVEESFFSQLREMRNTRFFNTAVSKCAYFSSYVNSISDDIAEAR